jgi:NADPH:quinone reductase-like Zn-dependent oxidoreductase
MAGPLGRLQAGAAVTPVVGMQPLAVGRGGNLDGDATEAAPLDGRYGRTLEIPKCSPTACRAVLPLDQMREALARVMSQHTRGKIVLQTG